MINRIQNFFLIQVETVMLFLQKKNKEKTYQERCDDISGSETK